MNARKMLILGLGLALTLTLVGVVYAKNPVAVNQIVLHDQQVHGGILMVDAVTAEKPGWLVVYKRPAMDTDSIIGYAPVKMGLNQNIRLTLDPKFNSTKTTQLWARLHVDNKPVGTFEWGLFNRSLNDPPVVENSREVIVPFWTTGDSALQAIVPSITIKNQDLNHTNPIIVEAVTTPADGWLVIYRDVPGDAGKVVGYTPVYQGTNQNVKVAINTDRTRDRVTLYAMLHTDQGTHAVFEWGNRYEANADVPLIYQGKTVVIGFGTTNP